MVHFPLVRWPLALALSLLTAGCGPAAVHLEVPSEPLLVYDTEPIRLDMPPLDEHGRRIPHLAVTVVASSDPDILSISPTDGLPRCRTWGEATLTVAAAEASAVLPVRCRLLGGLAADQEAIRLVYGEETLAAATVGWTAWDDQQRPVTDLPVRMRILDPNLASMDEQRLVRARSAGQTSLRIEVGGKKTEVPITIGEVVGRVDLELGGNLNLPAGELDLLLIENASPVRLAFYAAGSCKEAILLQPGESQTCRFQEAGHLNLLASPGGHGRVISVRWPENGALGGEVTLPPPPPLPDAHSQRQRAVKEIFNQD